jgi:TolA-binding protein
MTQKRRSGKYPFNQGRNKGRINEVTGTSNPEDDELVNIVEVKEYAEDFVERNQKLIIGILAAIVILVGGYMVNKYLIVAPKEKAAIEAMRQAQTQFAKDSFNLALTNPGGGFEGFLDIVDNYSGTNAGNTANYYAGISYLNLGKYQAALDYLDNYSPKDDITPAMKYGAIGDAHAELGDYEKALSMYNKAASEAGNSFVTPYYLKKVGLLNYKNGDNEAAKAAFQTILDEYPAANEANEAEKFIARLNG